MNKLLESHWMPRKEKLLLFSLAQQLEAAIITMKIRNIIVCVCMLITLGISEMNARDCYFMENCSHFSTPEGMKIQ